jgi:DNA (cytosine-5)-methyltransferase 1
MKLLDLFCGAGGASVGYHRAGFEIVGVDNRSQKHYPFEFHLADAFDYLRDHGREFDVIHASPPCQAFSIARVIHGRKHPDLLTGMRAALMVINVPFVIENVPGAPMRRDILCCGSMFGLRVRRHRLFELWKEIGFLWPECDHTKQIISVFGHGGHIYHGVADWRDAMGIDWMSPDELAQAIPPTYTEWIGKQLMKLLKTKGEEDV